MTMPTNQCPWRMQVHHITQETPDVWTISLICHDYYPYRAGQYALVEARHFLGLYRNRVGDKSGMKDCFKANIFAAHLFRGISSFSDVFFFIKLLGKLF